MALAPFTLPVALIKPGVEILPLTLALPNIFPLMLSWPELIVPLVVILPPAPAALPIEISNPVPNVTLPKVLIVPLWIFPLRDKLAPRILPVNTALLPLTLPVALINPGVDMLPLTLALPNMFPLTLSCPELIVPLVVMLPPAPAALVNERSDPVPNVTLPLVLIAPLVTVPATEILPVLILPLTLKLGKVPIEVATTPVSCEPLPIK